MKNFFFFLFQPKFWIMNNPYCPFWDKKVTELAVNFEFKNRDKYVAFLDDEEIWISNYPYAAYTKGKRPYKVRPSRRTIYYLQQKLENETNL